MMEESFLKILISFGAGALLGLEREYNDKPAGFRTLILITMGSTLFTMVSSSFDVNPERVASNIVTGIGFIGAGVMFRQGVDIKGITTAAAIWIAAAIGMAIAQGMYELSAIVLVVVLGTLLILNKIEKRLFYFKQKKTYELTFKVGVTDATDLNNELRKHSWKFSCIRMLKRDDRMVAIYKIAAGVNDHAELESILVRHQEIESFEV